MEKLNVKQVKCVKDGYEPFFTEGKTYRVVNSNEHLMDVIDNKGVDRMIIGVEDGLFKFIIPEPEPLDLTKILKVGDKVYSPVIGDCIVESLTFDKQYPIELFNEQHLVSETFSANGYIRQYTGEPLIFPSKENRDWSTWKREEFKKGDVCLFWDNNEDVKYPGIFHSEDEDGYNDSIFEDGKLIKYTCWQNCELYNPENIEI